ncbi:2-keto-3-deoxy-galactonokinase [Frateuria sp. Soil773]|uniref:2-dehydro-3-deoxygalactonokinase n=1 Tax=Frateuria sp. Soil773 TaxID=1736407 RepID=UPI0006F735CB|nr:2-dehydro-3-deoxygalactonokinase [Frateuria sp. Soil773]KRE89321.1 2-keto-3-deoxy-galactonokinase [Frateuria sp. Soil773]
MDGLIGLDWGTTRLRAYRFDGAGRVQDTRTRPWGIRSLPAGGYEAALADVTAGWPALPRLACGMVGSRGGWLEAPYVDLPAGADALCAAVRRLRAADGMDLHIVPGLRNPTAPDVMRGEETQLLGAVAQRPASAARSAWILPGTHSKWATVEGRAVTGFRTYLTGELYALLREHSILGAGIAEAVSPAAFARGVDAARDSGAQGATSRLFATRALMLEGALAPAEVPDYLSGLLIGEEFRSALAGGLPPPGEAPGLIGEPALCERYRQAAARFGLALAPPVADAAALGLWHVAGRIGLVHDRGRPASEESSPC